MNDDSQPRKKQSSSGKGAIISEHSRGMINKPTVDLVTHWIHLWISVNPAGESPWLLFDPMQKAGFSPAGTGRGL